jgi:hypothetical protein
MRTFSDLIDAILNNEIVHDIGQISKADLKLLNKAAKTGAISKGKGGEFPALKTVFAPKGFDFTGHRNAVVAFVNDIESGNTPSSNYLTHRWNYQEFISK